MNLLLAPLGRTDLQVSRLGFGCSTIASLGTRYSAAEVQATLLAAFDRGVNFFDTADVYGQGDSERLLGRLFAGRRDRVVIATKAGMRLAHSQQAIRIAKPLLQPLLRRWATGRERSTRMRQASERQCFDPAYLRARVEQSLKRLRTDRLDLLLLHSPPVEVAQHDEVLALLQCLRREGKVREFGVSVAEVAHARQWAMWPGLSCLQLPLTPRTAATGDPLALPAETLGLLEELSLRGIGVIAREVFGGGLWASEHGDRTSALRALFDAAGVSVVLAGMGSREHLNDNLNAFAEASLPALSP
ncbi:MAG: aldo/keto reductase [Propionivibrio sp.]|uniref:aldo/keto reductase n=1 Tax=Propionivibrio sp. TaxID=2212460 RepID=UPI001A5CC19F|nr:aldo/keto reductase [Propionivibrio sp.]MBL8414918.1 aldo/keto reductase [Propionivibrio sp.]